jgi:TolA-binding protein
MAMINQAERIRQLERQIEELKQVIRLYKKTKNDLVNRLLEAEARIKRLEEIANDVF